MNINEYFEKESEVWKFKHQALTAAYKLFGLFINFNYATSEIDQVDDENEKLIDDFDTHKYDNYKDRIVVIKEV